MNSRTLDKYRPTKQFTDFTQKYGRVRRAYDPLDELLLFPTLIAIRGRAASFTHWRNQIGHEFNAECHYLTTASMDGYSFGRAGNYYLSVCDVVAYATLDIFSLAFSLPTFFPTIGDPTLEDAERVARRDKPLGYGFLRRLKKQAVDFEQDVVPPKCPIRSLAALYFSGMALEMIWTHELSHAVQGHIDFAHANLGVRPMKEKPRRGGELCRMPMEAEADRFAVITALETALTGGGPYLPLKLGRLPPAIRVTAVLVVAALLSWFWSLQQHVAQTFDGLDPFAHGTHPPPLVRLHIAFDAARRFLAFQGWPAPMIEQIVFESMISLEALSLGKSWFSILNPAHSFGEGTNRFVKDVKEIMADAFREIEASLMPYRFVMPPPAE